MFAISSIISFEAVSSTDWKFPYKFNPTLFVDISSQLNSKIKAISEYKNELRSFPHPRSAKTITLSKLAQEALDIHKKTLSPDELIRKILKSPVDLLWNGGIGTYVKSSQENDVEVGDRANDNVRVDACDLQCKIVGEGGNLGFTQRGRIEYALKGGKINTDSIDNSAGVDCSDHEVNIKIALRSAIEHKKLNYQKRNKLLEEMTDEVEDLVLRDNFLQTQAISIAEFQGVKALEQHDRMMKKLEREGLLDRQVEFYQMQMR